MSVSFIKGEQSPVVYNITMAAKLNLSVFHLNLEREAVLTNNAAIFFQTFSNLKELMFSGISLDDNAANLMAFTLTKHLCVLELLDLSNCQLNSHAIMIILPYDKEQVPVVFETLTVLDISRNKITKSSVCPLVKSFLQMPKLQSLKIAGNQLKTESIATFDIMFNDLKSQIINYTSEIHVFIFSESVRLHGKYSGEKITTSNCKHHSYSKVIFAIFSM